MMRKLRLLRKVLYTKKYASRTDLVSDRDYNIRLYRILFGRTPDIDRPQTFNEHIISRKVLRDEYDLARYTDKYEVREYVRDKLGPEFLNGLICVFDTPDEINAEKLPDAFALKGNHGSGYNIIVPDKALFNRDDAVNKFRRWMSENYYFQSREKNYKNIQPRILCEEYIAQSPENPINETKFWCFGGKVKIIIDTRVINGTRCAALYDSELSKLPVTIGYPAHGIPLQDNIKDMIAAAEALAKNFDFVRVDLYNVGKKPYFSELTFHPSGGFIPFNPPEWDKKFGGLFDEIS